MPKTFAKTVIFLLFISYIFTGCKSGAVVVDTGSIERLRNEYRQLRSEYEKLRSDYQELAGRSQFFADYYKQAADRIDAGIAELETIGAGNAAEIAKLRTGITEIRKIIDGTIRNEPAAETGN